MVSGAYGRSRAERRYRQRQPRRTPNSPTNSSSPNPPGMSQQQAGEILGLPYLSPTNKALVIKGKPPKAFMGKPYEGTYENYMAMMQKRLKAVEKIQAVWKNPRLRIGRLEKKASNLAQRLRLLQEEDRLRGELNAMSPNSPSPPRGSMNHNEKIRLFNNNPTYRNKMLELRARANPIRSPREARYYNKLKQLYTTGRAKKVANQKKARAERIEKRRGKRKRPRQAQKPRKKKKPTLAQFNKKMTSKLPKIRTTNSPTIAQIQRNLLAATAKNARRARIEKRRGLVQIKKRYTLTDLITGKIKTFTKKGWYDRAVAKQQILRTRICA